MYDGKCMMETVYPFTCSFVVNLVQQLWLQQNDAIAL